jgi:aspartate aminotransferase-like enzyme
MGTRVKPVQPTEIKDIKIVREVIAQIRQKPTAAALKRHKEMEEALKKAMEPMRPSRYGPACPKDL